MTSGRTGAQRRWSRTAFTVVAVAAAYAAGAVVGVPGRDPGQPASTVVDSDGDLPGGLGLSLRGWEVSRDAGSDEQRTQCLLVQPGQPEPGVDAHLTGAVVRSDWPRRIKPDPFGRTAALVTCRDTATGRQVLSVEVRPRAYASASQPGSAVSEVPVAQPLLDSIAALAARGVPLTSATIVYFVTSGSPDARAVVDGSGTVEVPAGLLGEASLSERVVFHALLVKALRERLRTSGDDAEARALYAAYDALLADVPDGAREPGNETLRALWPGTYAQPAVDVRAGLDDVAAAGLLVWHYHRDSFTARLRTLPRRDSDVVERFLARVVRVLTAPGPAGAEPLERLVPGAARLADPGVSRT